MKIQAYKHEELPLQLKKELQNIEQSEFGHVPIVKSTVWATPDYSIVALENGELLGHLNLVQRTILWDKEEMTCTGINNLIVNPKARGKKLGSYLLFRAKTFALDVLDSKLMLLLCAKELVPFYARHQWEKINVPVSFNQPLEKNLLWQAETMVLPLKPINLPIETIYLNGLPW